MMLEMRRALTLALLAWLGILLVPAALSAQIYRWVDDAGVPQYTEGLDSVPERHRANARPVGLRSKPAAPEGPAPPAPVRGPTTIRYVPGRPIVTDVLINGTTSARLIGDTGAARPMINPRTLTAAGVLLTGVVARGRIVGVTGSDEMSYVVVNTLDVGGVRVERIPVGAYHLPESDTDGLLGRDVLDRFTVSIDSARGVV